MHYVKQFNINGVDTKQVACIELHGKPNAATEGCVGVLGVDVDSPTHEVYKCVAVNGSIYTWELLSSGMSTITAIVSYQGTPSVSFTYDSLRTPAGYVVKRGDLIFDAEGYVYQVSSIGSQGCDATYCEINIIPKKGVDYFTEADKKEMVALVKEGAIGDIEDALDNIIAIQNGLQNIDIIITFSIVGVYDSEINFVLSAKKGMTWHEWVDSDYNTIGAFVVETVSDLKVALPGYSGAGYTIVYKAYNEPDTFDNALGTDVIENRFAYQAVGY